MDKLSELVREFGLEAEPSSDDAWETWSGHGAHGHGEEVLVARCILDGTIIVSKKPADPDASAVHTQWTRFDDVIEDVLSRWVMH